MENKAITPIQQFSILRHEFPESSGTIHCGAMTWFGEFTPSPLSDTYKLKITYKQGQAPKAYIVSPKPLQLAEGAKRLPHTYSYSNGKQQLCLYLPGTGEWRPSMVIAQTIVHWAVQWMYYYEIWVTTGKWMGGGHGNWDVEKDGGKISKQV